MLLIANSSLALLHFTRPEEPRVKNPRFSLEEVITGEYEPRIFNGSWISDTEVTFRDPDGAIVIYNARTAEKTIIVNNITLVSNYV
ncbi:hypothetical protein TNCT_315071 [Trichonephila clavata]|uniref:Dipeptidylpeptidase IV N-terminal domain-containing protein n=1 Tax=Trichonephila clavata TaxID=2740835 RepID=A0A8X6GMR3_TRICU|nr:hypothetical protein TNCT_315071 [Trichonephila clavata]